MNDERNVAVNRTAVDISLLILRVVGGVIFTAHGGQKLLGAWGGPGLATTIERMGPWLGYPVTIGEFFGGLGLIVGLLTRFSAASMIVIMIGAIATVHGQNGFFNINKGYEYNLALIGLMAPIVILGAGRIAVGRFLPLPKARNSDRPIAVLE